MIIEKTTQEELQTSLPTIYKIYDIVKMEDAEGNEVSVKQLSRQVTREEVVANISNIENEIASLQSRKLVEENILTEIDALN
mgnify:FL=1